MPYRKASNWMATSALAIALLGNVAVYTSRTAVSHDNCVQIEKMKSYVLGAIDRGRTTLPTLAYYKTHPAELRSAIHELVQEQSDFKPSDCGRQLLPWN